MKDKKQEKIKPMTNKQLNYLAYHTIQWCQIVLKQGRRFLDALEQSHGDLPWEEENCSMFLGDRVFFITAIYHAISNLERFNYELDCRNECSSFGKILDAICTLEERKKIRIWRNMNEHDSDYLTEVGNNQDKFKSSIKKENYLFNTDAFTTIVHGGASVILVGDIDIGKLLIKSKRIFLKFVK